MVDRALSDRDDAVVTFMDETPRLDAFFRRSGIAGAEREDLVQETMLRVLQTDWGAVGKPRSYLWRIARNLMIDWRRAEARRSKVLAPVDPGQVAADQPSVEAAHASSEDLKAMMVALRELPARRRDIFVRASLLGEPCSVVAESYGVSRRTVEIEARKALEHCARRLRRKLG
ncbi:MAG: RNA polymerase sigma factor [Pseudomonadota bacterium]